MDHSKIINETLYELLEEAPQDQTLQAYLQILALRIQVNMLQVENNSK